MRIKYVPASPAYGRDYKTEEEVRADWEAGKDFLNQSLVGGTYVNKDDLVNGETVNIRYNNLQDVCVIGPGDSGAQEYVEMLHSGDGEPWNIKLGAEPCEDTDDYLD